MRINKSNIIKVMIQVVFIIIILIIGSKPGIVLPNDICLMGFISLISLFAFILGRYVPVISISWLTVIFLYLYSFGQIWLLLFGADLPNGSFQVTQYGNEVLFKSIVFALSTINCLQLSLLVFRLFSKRARFSGTNSPLPENSLKYASLILFLFCLAVVTYNDLIQIAAAKTIGYVGAFVLGRNNQIIQIGIYLFPFAICLLLLVSKPRIKKLILTYSVLRCLVMMILVGNRGQYIALLAVLLLIYFHDLRDKSKKTSFLFYFKYFLIGVGVIVLASYIALTRNITASQTSVVDVLTKNNIIVQLLNEMGGTLINTEIAINIIPTSLPVGKGISYIGSLIQLIPNMSSMLPGLVKFNDLGVGFNSYFTKGSGLGGSYIAEMYFNFGWFSLLFQCLAGWGLTRLDNILLNSHVGLLKKAIVYFYAHAIFMYLRGNFSEMAVYTRFLIYFMVFYLVLRFLIKQDSRLID